MGKKKKNKQGKATEDANQNHHASNNNNNNRENGDAHHSQVDLHQHRSNGTPEFVGAEAENRNLLQEEEAILLATNKEPEMEKATHILNEVTLEEKIKRLQSERDIYILKQADLEETIKQLRGENDSLLKKEASLEASVKKFQDEVNLHHEREASLEEEMRKLRSENDSRMQKEAGLEERIKRLSAEKASLELKQAGLEDKIKHLEEEKEVWVINEKTTKETISSLDRDVARLRMQVVELEDSKNQLLQERKQLRDNLSTLHLQLENLERSSTPSHSLEETRKHASTDMDLNSQIEAAYALVDRLVNENAELVEKVSELVIKLEHQSVAARPSTSLDMPDVSGFVPKAVHNSALQRDGDDPLDVREDATFGNENVIIQHSGGEHSDSGEIVQIPLDDTDTRDLESQVMLTDEDTAAADAVPLADAPLIGAPFRLISFFAKYVSGADLVDKNAIHQEP